MSIIIKDNEWTKVAESKKPDTKQRVILPKIAVGENVSYHIYTNSIGQIILDPQVTIPASELWVFKDKNVLASIDKGMKESTNGQVVRRGSFAKYVKNAS